MLSKRKSVSALVLTFIFGFALQAQAVSITFNYQVPTDGSGKTSPFVNGNNTAPTGYFIETFDQPGSAGATVNGITIAAGGGFNTLDPTKLDVTGGLGIRQGSVANVAAAPAGDNTFYAYAPGPGSGTTNANIKVDYTDFFAFQDGLYISYLGLYLGSIDTYNNIAFYSGNSLLQTAEGLLSDGILQGTEILGIMNGNSGNQVESNSNVYVNLFFALDEMFTAFEFRTTGLAFEIDNVVAGVSINPVPEPSTFLLLGGGLLGLGFIARRRKQ